jgi:ferric-dicitrate binding protein FerR (iron transport regulator)
MRHDTDAMPTDAVVERLLRMADCGPDLPGDGAQRVKEAVRPLWRRTLRDRARRRLQWLVGAAAAAAVVAAIALSLIDRGPTAGTPAPVARLEALRGAVEIVSPSGDHLRVEEAGPDVQLGAGSWVHTDAASRVALRLAGGQSLRLDLATSVRLESPALVRLDRGGLYVDSDGAAGDGVRVETPLGEVREIGTRFEVRREEGPVLVRVRGGRVAIVRGGHEVEVSEGSTLAITADGRLERSSTAAHASEWDWVQLVAPAFEIEGRTVEAFLDWVSSETGLSVTYQDSRIEQFAAATILHGTVGKLTPNQTPEVVLPSCGLQVIRDGSTLVVERGRQSPATR